MTKLRLTKRDSRPAPIKAGDKSTGNPEHLPPNAPIEIVFCFDTTGSMSGVIDTVKNRVIELTERLLADIAGIRIGILAHGDYGDEPYLLQHLDLSSDAVQLCDFIRNVRGTCGGDGEECYELALHEVRTSFSWSPATRKRLVIIGDNLPHALGSRRNMRKLDWRQETLALKNELHLSIYSVQVNTCERYEYFWKALADLSGGKYLQLESMSSIFDFLMAICYLEHGVEYFEAFEEEVRGRSEPCAGDVATMLVRLEDEGTAAPDSSATDSDEDDEEASRRVSKADGLRGVRHRPLKTKRSAKAIPKATKAASAAATAVRTSRKRLVKAAAPAACRARRESEPLSAPDSLGLCGRWSRWQVIASSRQPHDGTRHWRRFGLGWLRTKVGVVTRTAQERVLVEVGVRRDADGDKDDTGPVLYSRILRRGAHNAVPCLLQANNALKWQIHRAVSRGLSVQMRWTRVTAAADAADTASSSSSKLRRQRRLLFKSNSYAWNSGRVVRAQHGGELLSVPAPRQRLMGRFLRRLDEESRMEVSA